MFAHRLAISVVVTLFATALGGNAPTSLKIQPVLHAPIDDGFTIATVGDVAYIRPMRSTIAARSPATLKPIEEADVGFGNFEANVLDLRHFAGAPQAEAGGTWIVAAPGVPSDLKAMGFDLVSVANNHSTDWGAEGLLETSDRLDEAGLVHAGTGLNLSAAEAPRYLDSAKGRIGLVAASSTFTPMSPAADPIGEVPGRPGLNIIRTVRTTLLPAKQLEALSAIAAALNGDKANNGSRLVDFAGQRFGLSPTGQSRATYSMNPLDVAANLRAVRQSSENGNFTIFSLHNHEPGNDDPFPADFAVSLAHQVIQAGADIFVGHGPHLLRGIEIYKGKPIFYSLGNFAFMVNSSDDVPADMYEQFNVTPGAAITAPELLSAVEDLHFPNPRFFESVIAVSRFVHGAVVEIKLYPLDLGWSLQGAAKGVPSRAKGALARQILERLQTLSLPFGTHIKIDHDVGIIRPDSRLTAARRAS